MSEAKTRRSKKQRGPATRPTTADDAEAKRKAKGAQDPAAKKSAAAGSEVPRRRPYWSGTITFGLVTLPVDLYPATRSAGVPLRMIDDDGTLLRRRYYCPYHNLVLDSDDIVRGYPIGDGTFVIIEEGELDALDPERSQEIDLTRFVPAHDVDAAYIENVYVLAPGDDAQRAYSLLARSLEVSESAGMATMVMRGKQHVVALTGQGGILRLAALRFDEELRTPEQVGLPDLVSADMDQVAAMEADMGRLEKPDISRIELEDATSRRLLDLIAGKLRRDEDVFKQSEEPSDDGDSDETVDIMDVLRRRLTKA